MWRLEELFHHWHFRLALHQVTRGCGFSVTARLWPKKTAQDWTESPSKTLDFWKKINMGNNG